MYQTDTRIYASLLGQTDSAISELKEAALYRDFLGLSTAPELGFPYFETSNGSTVSTFCSNDYLAMSRSPWAIEAAIRATEDEGVGAGGSRNIGGTRTLTMALEEELADLHGTEAALVLNSGYLANFVPMKVFSKRFDAVVFSDEKNHASIIDGLDTRKRGVDKHVFRHNDLDDLRSQLQRHCDPKRPAIVIFESLYSMEGDYAPIPEMIRLAKEFGAAVFLNEVHAVGVIGREGGGVSADLDCRKDIDLFLGTLAKGFGTYGGYVAGRDSIVNAIRSFGGGLIFTTALPPAVMASSLANVRHLRSSDVERRTLGEKTDRLKRQLRANDIPILYDESHICAVPIGDEMRTVVVTQRLMEAGYYVTPIRYPTVPRGDGRLRLTVTPRHDESLIDSFVEALTSIYQGTQ